MRAAGRSLGPALGLALAVWMLVPADPAAAEAKGEPAVLVELFTSQGCSSCPPADRLLSELVAQDRVVALAFHVDYWNYIGWTDPFSSAAWSERQRGYAAVFGSNRIYTPQLVVNGRWEGVGADRREVERLLATAAASPLDELSLVVEDGGDRLTARIRASGGSGRPRGAWLAIAESGFETPVGRGENAHRKLHNDNVVRRLEPVALAPDGGDLSATVEIEIAPEWNRDRLRLVAFLQHRQTMAVTAVAQAALP